jgi:GNAT superfamily N-acetyltransferase
VAHESGPLLVPFEPLHADDAVAVVRAVYREYGFTWEAEGYHADLYDPIGHYVERGGTFLVLVDSGRVIGTVGVARLDDHTCELHRMYLSIDHRGRGLGRRMLTGAVDWARAAGFARMIAWSDVKLTTAHGLYRSYGFEQRGKRVCVADPDQALEFGFSLNLRSA